MATVISLQTSNEAFQDYAGVGTSCGCFKTLHRSAKVVSSQVADYAHLCYCTLPVLELCAIKISRCSILKSNAYTHKAKATSPYTTFGRVSPLT